MAEKTDHFKIRLNSKENLSAFSETKIFKIMNTWSKWYSTLLDGSITQLLIKKRWWFHHIASTIMSRSSCSVSKSILFYHSNCGQKCILNFLPESPLKQLLWILLMAGFQLHPIVHITILACNTKKQHSSPRFLHAQMCQFIALYAPLLSLGILPPYRNIMPCSI